MSGFASTENVVNFTPAQIAAIIEIAQQYGGGGGGSISGIILDGGSPGSIFTENDFLIDFGSVN